jgi:F420-dependent oxidoreductase-like protein
MAVQLSFWLRANTSWTDTLEAARTAHALGYRGLWIADHFMPMGTDPMDGPTHEAMSMLAALAATVPDVRLGTMVVGNTYRNPCVLAKQFASVDQISGGRAVLGLGAGWQENEHRAYGIDFNTFAWRFDRLEEAVRIIRSLLREPRTTFEGRHYTVLDAPLDPKPANPAMPILIGGGGPNRTLPIVARWADEWNIWGTPETLAEKGALLTRRCEEIGRDPGSVHRTAVALVLLTDSDETTAKLRARDLGRPALIGQAGEMAELLRGFAAAGVHEFIVPDFTFASPAQREDVLGRLMADVLPQV